jgi:hypothetical protein
MNTAANGAKVVLKSVMRKVIALKSVQPIVAVVAHLVVLQVYLKPANLGKLAKMEVGVHQSLHVSAPVIV